MTDAIWNAVNGEQSAYDVVDGARSRRRIAV